MHKVNINKYMSEKRIFKTKINYSHVITYRPFPHKFKCYERLTISKIKKSKKIKISKKIKTFKKIKIRKNQKRYKKKYFSDVITK